MNFFDLHCDTLGRCCETKRSLLKNEFHLDILRGSVFSRWIQCFAVFIPDELRGKCAVDFFDRHYTYYLQTLNDAQGELQAIRTMDDLTSYEKSSMARCGSILTVEGGAACGGTLEGVQHLAECGVRMLTLTWNGSCEFGGGAMTDTQNGLTEFGRAAIMEMERLGIVVDVSHASEPLFWDVEAIAQKPYAASHSNARTVHEHPRNLTDDQFTAINNRGGIVGINLFPQFVNGKADASFTDILRHVEHFLSLGGEKNVCMGTDFDGADMPSEIDCIEKVYRLAEAMQTIGYSEKLIEDIMFQNAFSFFIENLQEEITNEV